MVFNNNTNHNAIIHIYIVCALSMCIYIYYLHGQIAEPRCKKSSKELDDHWCPVLQPGEKSYIFNVPSAIAPPVGEAPSMRPFRSGAPKR